MRIEDRIMLGSFIPAVKGVPQGLLVGRTYDGDVAVWEVIRHAGLNFTVRQPGANEDTGVVIGVPASHAAIIFKKIGVICIKGKKPPWPDTPVSWKLKDRRLVHVKIGEFVDAAWELLENTVGSQRP